MASGTRGSRDIETMGQLTCLVDVGALLKQKLHDSIGIFYADCNHQRSPAAVIL